MALVVGRVRCRKFEAADSVGQLFGHHHRGALAAGGIALALGASWMRGHTNSVVYDPRAALVAYELVLLLVAVTFRIAIRVVPASSFRTADQSLGR